MAKDAHRKTQLDFLWPSLATSFHWRINWIMWAWFSCSIFTRNHCHKVQWEYKNIHSSEYLYGQILALDSAYYYKRGNTKENDHRRRKKASLTRFRNFQKVSLLSPVVCTFAHMQDVWPKDAVLDFLSQKGQVAGNRKNLCWWNWTATLFLKAEMVVPGEKASDLLQHNCLCSLAVQRFQTL